jgi:hypothetical protein
MTDKFDDLMYHAGLTAQGCWDQMDDYDRTAILKFAELIIRECAEVCMKEIDTGWVMAPKSPWMAKQILEHFGVEE